MVRFESCETTLRPPQHAFDLFANGRLQPARLDVLRRTPLPHSAANADQRAGRFMRSVRAGRLHHRCGFHCDPPVNCLKGRYDSGKAGISTAKQAVPADAGGGARHRTERSVAPTPHTRSQRSGSGPPRCAPGRRGAGQSRRPESAAPPTAGICNVKAGSALPGASYAWFLRR